MEKGIETMKSQSIMTSLVSIVNRKDILRGILYPQRVTVNMRE